MTAHQLTQLTRFINDHRKMLACPAIAIPCAGFNLQQVRAQLEAVCKESNEHSTAAFPPEDNEEFGPDLRDEPLTEAQREHLDSARNLKQYINPLKQLVAAYELLVSQTN
jgi:hypothetical protein